MMRTCKTCGQTKTLTDFPLAQNGLGARYRRRECKACYGEKMRVYSREYQRTHPKKRSPNYYRIRRLARVLEKHMSE